MTISFHTTLFYGNPESVMNAFLPLPTTFPHNTVLRKREPEPQPPTLVVQLSTQHCSTETLKEVRAIYRENSEKTFHTTLFYGNKLFHDDDFSAVFPHNTVLRKRQPASSSSTCQRHFPHNTVLRKHIRRVLGYPCTHFFPHNTVLRKQSGTPQRPLRITTPFHTTLFYGNPLEISIFSQNKRSYNSYLSLTVKTRVTARHL